MTEGMQSEVVPGRVRDQDLLRRVIVRFDTHAHLYPAHDVATWLASGMRSTEGDSRIVPVVTLTERKDEASFARVQRELPEGWVWTGLERGAGGVISNDEGVLILLHGAQYISAEGIEVLDIARPRQAFEGAATGEIVRLIREEGGVPCIPWSPGKWLGKRGEVIRELIEGSLPGQLAVGDIVMRPRLSPEPALMKMARERGLIILAGSDPLPQAGEERLVGSYGVEVAGGRESSPQELVDWVFGVFSDPIGAPLESSVELFGRRQSVVAAGIRWGKNRVRKGR